ncbi:hypothetical protein B0T16DRAFT_451062 [Cercophora newfieldiana]|uniref:Uncharacterized protein n=1 Tax=Cercophora newfieldiana TaxID=92897 RepID=A0AA39YMQ0_9PEZI|nr:hypothetical protein B0T16DRAFT_451062 [Cercophora newfieldiana]
MPDSPIVKKRQLPFKRTVERHRKPRLCWFIQYKRAFGGTQRHFDERGWEPCDMVWAKKCVTHVPAPDGKGVLTGSELYRLHRQKRCPCFVKDYGGDLHRWCTRKYHFEGVRVRRGVKGEIDGVGDDGLALWSAGIMQTGITDFFQPTLARHIEELGQRRKRSRGAMDEHKDAVRKLRSEKQRLKRALTQQIRDEWTDKQAVVDIEAQCAPLRSDWWMPSRPQSKLQSKVNTWRQGGRTTGPGAWKQISRMQTVGWTAG